MDHDTTRRLLSLDLDGELDAARSAEVEDHLAGCPSCAAFADRLVAIRRALRDDVEPGPDVRAGVLAAIGSATATEARGPAVTPGGPRELQVVGHRVEHPSETSSVPLAGETVVVARTGWDRGARVARRWLPVAACFAVGLLLGSVLVGGWRSTPSPAAAQVPEHVAAAQFEVTSLSATISITERGWNAQVPERSFVGTIDYQAPEALALHLVDETAYPSAEWVANDVDLVRRDLQWWARGPRDCPSTAQPGCTSVDPRLEVIDHLAPYDDGAAVPLDLVVPVRSFLRASEPTGLGERTIGGRDAVGVEVSAAQVAPLLDGLRPAGNLRQFFPSDVVSLWLDAGSWTPVRIEVRASDDPDRRTWAVNRGYVDQPGDEVLLVSVDDATVGAGVASERLQPAPDGGVRRDAGFLGGGDGDGSDGIRIEVDPASLPDGLEPSTTGVVGADTDRPVAIQTWAGGRGWVKVASTTGWDGTRLFGDLGSPVRRRALADGSIVYASLDGTRQAVHTDGIDVVVTGSVDEAALVRVVEGLDVAGEAVPGDWDEAATETLGSAADLLPGLLVPAAGSGFEDAAVRADGNVVTQGYAGAGGRGFVVVEAPGERLPPPLDMDVAGVVVRGVDGRYSAARGELEWVEADRVHRIASSTLTRAELVAVADAMVRS